MSAMCPLCREENTPEHQISQRHVINTQLVSEGKMPLTENTFQQWLLTQGGGAASPTTPSSADPTSPAPAAASTTQSTHNVKGWHWQNQPMNTWFYPTLKQHIQSTCNIPHPTVEGKVIKLRIQDIVGDAYLSNRKGKISAGFMVDLKLDIRCRLDDDLELKYSALVPEVESSDIDDAVLTAIKFEGDAAKSELNAHKDPTAKAIKAMHKLVIKAVNQTYKDMQQFVKNPALELTTPETPVVDFD